MTATVDGYPGRPPGSPFLATRPVPSAEAHGWSITADRAWLPFLLDYARWASRHVQPLNRGNCWSYSWRAIRTGSALSAHAGWAIDLWSGTVSGPGGRGIGAMTWPSAMPEDTARKISKRLEQYRTLDGRHLFLWGACNTAPGVIYTGPTYHYPQYHDPMHYALAPGIARDELREARKRLGIRRDGTRIDRAAA